MKVDKWGYEVRTSSDACISAIDDFYDQACLNLLSFTQFFCFYWFCMSKVEMGTGIFGE